MSRSAPDNMALVIGCLCTTRSIYSALRETALTADQGRSTRQLLIYSNMVTMLVFSISVNHRIMKIRLLLKLVWSTVLACQESTYFKFELAVAQSNSDTDEL